MVLVSLKLTSSCFCLISVYQGLIRSCSHPPVIEVEQLGEAEQSDKGIRKVTYKDFIDMWTGILDSTRMKVSSVNMWLIQKVFSVTKMLLAGNVAKNLLPHQSHKFGSCLRSIVFQYSPLSLSSTMGSSFRIMIWQVGSSHCNQGINIHEKYTLPKKKCRREKIVKFG